MAERESLSAQTGRLNALLNKRRGGGAVEPVHVERAPAPSAPPPPKAPPKPASKSTEPILTGGDGDSLSAYFRALGLEDPFQTTSSDSSSSASLEELLAMPTERVPAPKPPPVIVPEPPKAVAPKPVAPPFIPEPPKAVAPPPAPEAPKLVITPEAPKAVAPPAPEASKPVAPEPMKTLAPPPASPPPQAASKDDFAQFSAESAVDASAESTSKPADSSLGGALAALAARLGPPKTSPSAAAPASGAGLSGAVAALGAALAAKSGGPRPAEERPEAAEPVAPPPRAEAKPQEVKAQPAKPQDVKPQTVDPGDFLDQVSFGDPDFAPVASPEPPRAQKPEPPKAPVAPPPAPEQPKLDDPAFWEASSIAEQAIEPSAPLLDLKEEALAAFDSEPAPHASGSRSGSFGQTPQASSFDKSSYEDELSAFDADPEPLSAEAAEQAYAAAEAAAYAAETPVANEGEMLMVIDAQRTEMIRDLAQSMGCAPEDVVVTALDWYLDALMNAENGAQDTDAA